MSTLATPKTYAEELLDLCSGLIATTTGGEIERRYVDWGRPAFDCEQLVVSGMELGEADTTVSSAVGVARRHITGRLNLLTFLVTVVRDCAPGMDDNGNPPPPDEIDAAASVMFEDAWAIWTGVYRAMRDGDLFGGRCDLLRFDGARALDTSGGLMAVEIAFSADIPGITASGS